VNQKQETSNFLSIDLLKSFSKKELDLKLIRLFEVVKNKVLKTDFNDLMQDKVYQFVFEKSKNSSLDKDEKKTLRAKLSKLNQLAHQFLVVEHLNDNRHCFNNQLYKTLIEKRQFSSFLTLMKRDKKQLSLKKRKDFRDFEHLYKIELLYLDYLFLCGKLFNNKENNITSVMRTFDVYYLQSKMTYYMATLGFFNKSLFKFSLNKKLYEEIKGLSNLEIFDDQDILKVSKVAINFLEEPDAINYKNLFSMLLEKDQIIPISDLKSYYQNILNYLIEGIKKGNVNLEKDLVDLYFILDEKELLLDEGLMSTIKLKNIIGRLCKSNNFEEAVYFTEKYNTYTRLKDRKSIYNHCHATIAFYKEDYEYALERLLEVEKISNLSIEINHRLLIMKIYFEQDKHYCEKTERYYRSAEKFFSDNKLLSAHNKKSYKNFTQILINLYRLKHNEGRMTIEKLKQKLEEQDYNIDRK